ncbi:MAG: peptidyl-tRNA hydrolase Pth2 [Candidatus Aenigmatarchaeota archaeon]
MGKLKQVILVRTDLKMGKGKIAAQCCHAAVGTLELVDREILKKWEKEGSKKIVLKVRNEKELLEIYKKTKKEKIPCFLVKDAGLTQLKSGTITALGIGPDKEEKIDKITGKFKLL